MPRKAAWVKAESKRWTDDAFVPLRASQILPEAKAEVAAREQARRNADKIKYSAVDMLGVSLITGLTVLVFCMFAWK